MQAVGIPKEGRDGIGVDAGLCIIQISPIFCLNRRVIQLPGGVPVGFPCKVVLFPPVGASHVELVIPHAGGIGDELVFAHLGFQLRFGIRVPLTQHAVLGHQSGHSLVLRGLLLVEDAVAVGGDSAAVIVGSAQGALLGGLDAAVGSHQGHVQTGVVAAHLILPIEHTELAKILDVIRPVTVLDLCAPAADGGRIGIFRIFARVHGQLRGAVFIQGLSRKLLRGNRLAHGIGDILILGAVEAVQLIPVDIGAAVQVVGANDGAALFAEAVNLCFTGGAHGHARVAAEYVAAAVLAGEAGNDIGIVLILGLRLGHIDEARRVAVVHGAAVVDTHQAAGIGIGQVALYRDSGGLRGAGPQEAPVVLAYQTAHVGGGAVIGPDIQGIPGYGAVDDLALVKARNGADVDYLSGAVYQAEFRIGFLGLGSGIGFGGIFKMGDGFVVSQQDQVGDLTVGGDPAKQACVVSFRADVKSCYRIAVAGVGQIKGHFSLADGCLGIVAKAGTVAVAPFVAPVVQIRILGNHGTAALQQRLVFFKELAQRVQVPGAAHPDHIRHVRLAGADALGEMGIEIEGILLFNLGIGGGTGEIDDGILHRQLLIETAAKQVLPVDQVGIQWEEGIVPHTDGIAQGHRFAVVEYPQIVYSLLTAEGQGVAVAVDQGPVLIIELGIIPADVVDVDVAAFKIVGSLAGGAVVLKVHQSAVFKLRVPVAVVAHLDQSGIGVFDEALIHQVVGIAGIVNIRGLSGEVAGNQMGLILAAAVCGPENRVRGQLLIAYGAGALHRIIQQVLRQVNHAERGNGRIVFHRIVYFGIRLLRENLAGRIAIVHPDGIIGGLFITVGCKARRRPGGHLVAHRVEIVHGQGHARAGGADEAAGLFRLQVAVGIGAVDVGRPADGAHQTAGIGTSGQHRGSGGIDNVQALAGGVGAHQAAHNPALYPGLHGLGVSLLGGGQPRADQITQPLAQEHLDIVDGGFAGSNADEGAGEGTVAAGNPGAGHHQILDDAAIGAEQAHIGLFGIDGKPLNGRHNFLAALGDLLTRIAYQGIVHNGHKADVLCGIEVIEAVGIRLVFHKGDVAHLDGGSNLHPGAPLDLLPQHGNSGVQILQVTAVGNVGRVLLAVLLVGENAVVGDRNALGGDQAALGVLFHLQLDADIGAGRNLPLGVFIEAALFGIQAVQNPLVLIAGGGRQLGGYLPDADLLLLLLTCQIVPVGLVVLVVDVDGKLQLHGLGHPAGEGDLQLFGILHHNAGNQRVAEGNGGQVAAVVADAGPVVQTQLLHTQAVQPQLQRFAHLLDGFLAVEHGIHRTGFRAELDDPVVVPQLAVHTADRQNGGRAGILPNVPISQGGLDITDFVRLVVVIRRVKGTAGPLDHVAVPFGGVELLEAAGFQGGQPVLGGHVDDLCLAVQLPLADIFPQLYQARHADGQQDDNQRHHNQDLHQREAPGPFPIFLQLFRKQFHFSFLHGSVSPNRGAALDSTKTGAKITRRYVPSFIRPVRNR